MPKQSLVIFALLAGFCLSTQGVYGDQQNYSIGESAAAYLNIPVSARQSSLAGAGVAATRDISALTINPAGLAKLANLEAQALHGFWVQDIFYDHLAFGSQLGAEAGLAASITYFNFGSLDKYSLDALNNPVAEGSFTPYVLLFNAGIGHQVMTDLGLGVNLKVLSQQIDDYQASAFALDVGALYATPLPGLSAGLTLANIGSELDNSPLPLRVTIGAAFETEFQALGKDQLLATLEAAFPTASFENTDLIVGAEYWYDKSLALRAGYQLDQEAGLGGAKGFSAGLGVRYQMVDINFGFSSLGELGGVYQIDVALRL